MIKWPGLYMPPINLWNVPRLESEMRGDDEMTIQAYQALIREKDAEISKWIDRYGEESEFSNGLACIIYRSPEATAILKRDVEQGKFKGDYLQHLEETILEGVRYD